MPWVIGLDEAGYGPNLGPLVQTAIAAKLPEDDEPGWTTLQKLIYRAEQKAEKRVLIDDSKEVYTGKHGLRKLEHGLAALLGPFQGTLRDWLTRYALEGVLEDLLGEAWFDPNEQLPLYPDALDLRDSLAQLGVETRILGVKMVATPQFNKIVSGSDSKATVLTIGLIGLLMKIRTEFQDTEPIHVFCDKQGGRNFYSGAIQSAFPEGWVVPERESSDESRYRVESLDRKLKVSFQPRAESASVSVALASMLAKYLREMMMNQFNRFWSKQVPDLKATAGYPVDAKRFIKDIQKALTRLNIREEDVWRVR
jgi:ribonuclease HII